MGVGGWGWLALISAMYAYDGLDLHTLGRPKQLWFQNNDIQTTQAYLGNPPLPNSKPTVACIW